MKGRTEENDSEKDNDMKKTFHLCLSAGNETMFRDEQDYIHGFNSFALALAKTGSTGLAEAFMCNHCHLLVQTEDHVRLMHEFRLSYSHYFNHKYHRVGRLGEEMHFSIEVEGFHHTVAAACYVLRNPLHHGISPTPFGYPHSSANSIFRKELGKFHENQIISPRYHRRHIGKRACLPEHYDMSAEGLITRESVLDIAQMENLFATPRAYCYHMTRKTSEEWLKEQEKDKNGRSRITLEVIEKGVETESVIQMLAYENGKSDYRKKSDIGLCSEIDRAVWECYGKTSVYQLSTEEKEALMKHYQSIYHIGEKQLRRCLAMEYREY